jgi:hypothetical protein
LAVEEVEKVFEETFEKKEGEAPSSSSLLFLLLRCLEAPLLMHVDRTPE